MKKLPVVDVKEIERDPNLFDVVRSLRGVINLVNFLAKKMSFETNFDGYIAERVRFAAAGDASGGDVVKIQHLLGAIPKYRIVLRQTGNGVITDVSDSDLTWNDKIITLRNNGAVEVIATIMIARE